MTDVPSDSTGASTPEPINPSETPTSPSTGGMQGDSIQAPTPKPSKGRYVAIGAIIAVLGGGAALIASSGNDKGVVSSGTPVGAVESMIEVLGQGRIADLFRAEFPWMDDFGGVDAATFSTAGIDDGKIDGLTLEGIDLKYEVEEFGDTLAVVSIVDGAFKAGVDVSKLPAEYKAALPAGASGISYEDDFAISKLAPLMCPAETEGHCDPSVLKVVTVDDGAGWRVSWMHTAIYLATDATLDPGSVGGAESPEAMADAIEAAMLSGDPNVAVDLLDPNEFAWARDFRFSSDATDLEDSIALSIETTITDANTSTARMHVDSFKATGSDDGVPKIATFDGDCLFENGKKQGCISDIRETELGPLKSFSVVLDQIADEGLNFGLVNRDGRWFLSLAKTIEPFTPALAAASRDLEDLVASCKAEASGSGVPSSPDCALFSMGPLGLLGMAGSSTTSSSEWAPVYEDSY